MLRRFMKRLNMQGFYMSNFEFQISGIEYQPLSIQAHLLRH